MFHNLEGFVTFARDLACFAPSEIQIRGGKAFNPLEPESYDYDVEDIAHSLCTKARFNGHTRYTDGRPLLYSVAQHSVHVADLVQMARRGLVPGWNWDDSPSPALLGLLHDGPEFAVDDVVRPVKSQLTGYAAIEDRLMADMIRRFNIPTNTGINEAVRRVDNLILFLERDALMGTPEKPWINEIDHPRLSIFDVIPEFSVWSPDYAKERFLQKYREIVEHDGNYVSLEYRNRGYGLRSQKA
jgi:5'-deoxynucleotidase YfbR-like HD superfamily hydrolase